MKITPSIPKGTRDFDAQTIYKRKFVIDAIKRVYELFGFEPISTPTMEKLNVLTGKYGEEGDQLLFKVLNNGDYLDKVRNEALQERNLPKITSKISEKGLRYDLTVPFARYVAQHRNDISFPFKRYQIQPVWRADRPQKGRYREFYQCDADVIGTNSLLAESEFLRIYDLAFKRLGLPQAQIKLNNRKILAGIADVIGAKEKMMSMTIAIDKLDKIGIDKVTEELSNNDFSNTQIEQIKTVLAIKVENGDWSALETFLGQSEIGMNGIAELKEIINNLDDSTVNLENITIDVTLARGLTYYTGTIFEVSIPDSGIGSVSGGGRYDDLTEIFGLKAMSGVGISFGVDRIYDAIETLNAWPVHLKNYKTPTRVLVTYMSDEVKVKVMDFVEKLRFNHVQTEMYMEPAKLAKQFKYANDKGIPHVVVIGPDEIEKGEYQVKFMKTGNQQSMPPAYIINALKPKR